MKLYRVTVKRVDLTQPVKYTVEAVGPDIAEAMVREQMYPPHRSKVEIISVEEVASYG